GKIPVGESELAAREQDLAEEQVLGPHAGEDRDRLVQRAARRPAVLGRATGEQRLGQQEVRASYLRVQDGPEELLLQPADPRQGGDRLVVGARFGQRLTQLLERQAELVALRSGEALDARHRLGKLLAR